MTIRLNRPSKLCSISLNARLDKVLDVLSYKTKKRGTIGILEIASECAIADRSGHLFLDNPSFVNAINRCRLDIGPQEIDALFNHLQTNDSEGFADLQILISILKSGGISKIRRPLIQDMFTKLDYKGEDTIDLKLISSLFNPRNHYDVKTGRRTQDEIESQFKESIRLYSTLNHGSTRVDYSGFLDYWEFISPTIDNDNNFESLLRSAFRYNELPTRGAKMIDVDRFEKNHQKKQQPITSNPMENTRMQNYLAQLRDNLVQGGVRKLFQFYQVIKHNDHDNNNKLSCKEFVKSFKDMRLGFQDSDVINLFELFDINRSGFLDIPQFMCIFVPELDVKRQKTVDDLLDALASPTNASIISLNNIKKFYFARGHLDFIKKKRQDYEIKDEFFLMLNSFLGLSGGTNEAISREIMLQFFEIYSLGFETDNEFCDTLIGSFRMDRICGHSVAQSHYNDNRSDFGNISVQKSAIQHPFGTQVDLPVDRRPQTGKSIIQRPQTSTNPITHTTLNAKQVPVTKMQPPSVNHNIQHEYSSHDNHSLYQSQVSVNTQHNHNKREPERTPSRHHEYSPIDLRSSLQNSGSKQKQYLPTIEDARHSVIHQYTLIKKVN